MSWNQYTYPEFLARNQVIKVRYNDETWEAECYYRNKWGLAYKKRRRLTPREVDMLAHADSKSEFLYQYALRNSSFPDTKDDVGWWKRLWNRIK